MAQQHTERSFIMYCRGAVILACVLLLPVLAIFINAVHWPGSHGEAAAHHERLESQESADTASSLRSTPQFNSSASAWSSSSVPLPAEATAEPIFASPYQPMTPLPPTSSSPHHSREVSQVAFHAVPQPSNGFQGSDRITGATAVIPNTPNNFAALEKELQGLGANFYRLQTWGNHGEFYKFSCYASAPGNDRYQRHFQSIDRDPHQAMRHVIDEIKMWSVTHP